MACQTPSADQTQNFSIYPFSDLILEEQKYQDWIVLPDKVSPYENPSFQSPKTSDVLCYPQVVREVFQDKKNQQDISRKDSDWICFKHKNKFLYLPYALLVKKTVLPEEVKGNLPIGFEKVDRQTPLPLDYRPADLKRVARKWNYHDTTYPKLLRAEVKQSVERMFQYAESENIHFRVVSAYRPAESQRNLYLKKVGKDGPGQKLVAKPGHSEHQLGTTVDICGLDPKTVLNSEFGSTREGLWLKEFARKFGFRRTYTRENSKKTGYAPEPWHYRFVGVSDR